MSDLDKAIIFIRSTVGDLQGLYVFGSYETDTFNQDSDIDLAILCAHSGAPFEALQKKHKIRESLELMLNKNVDLIDLRHVNTIFQEEILITGKRIFTADWMACELFEDFVYCSAMDFRAFRAPHVAEILKRGSIYG